jgi:3-deoxy-7-phosphoheptulonate synthase
MRVYVEKARTSLGWKGLIYDPCLTGQDDLLQGLSQARELLIALNDLGIGCATEFVDPLVAPYISDLISWGFIGARTSSSQPHRQLASHLPMPVGFKNSLDGNISIALHGIKAASHPHTFLFPNDQGTLQALSSSGNPYTHLVLRGSVKEANHSLSHLEQVYTLLHQEGLATKIMIDCSHGNAQGDFNRQQEVFHDVLKLRRQGHDALVGIMLESYLHPGKQEISIPSPSLAYGVSITDPCLSWETTAELIHEAAASCSYARI